MRTTDDFRRSIVTSLATSMLNQRLREIAHNPDAPFLSAYAYHSDFNPTRSFFGAGGKTKNGHIEDGLDAVMTELRRAAENGFTDRELTAEKRRLESTVESMYKERDQFKSSSYARQLISSFLDHKPLISVEDRYDMTMEFLPEITVDEVNEMFAGWIVEDGRVIQVSSPEKTGLIVPGEEDLAALVAKVEAKEIEPYKDAVLEAPLFPVMPSPGAIAEKKKLPKVDTEQWTLSNGIKVIVRQTDFSKDEVIFQAFSPGGNSLVSDSDHLSAVTATAIAGESGLGPLDKIQLEKKLAGIQADVAPFISEIYEGLNGWSSVEDLEMLFKLINLTFTQPRFDEDANKTFLTRLKTQVNNRQYRPEAAFIDMMQRELSKNHPRRRPWEVSMLDELNFERSVNIYKERFADASDFTFVFVGNFKKRDLEKLCTLYLASLPTLNRNESWKDVGVGLPASGLMRTFYKGKEDKSMVKVVYSEQFDWNRKNRMLVNVTCRILSIRLREVLREEMSGTYGVAVRPDFQHYPRQQLQVDIDFGCSPSRAKTMLESALKEVNIMRLDMIKQEYLDKVKALLLNSHEVNLRENSFWLSNLAFCYQNDESPADILKFEELLEEITPEEVQACARKIFSDERMSIFMLYPEDFKKP
jgi:zinc protease